MNKISKGVYGTWLGLLGLGIIAGIVTFITILVKGHGMFNANDVLLWTLPLGAYVFLALASSGLALLASLPLVLGMEKYRPFAKRLVFLSIATLVGAFVCIGLELGSPFHILYIIFSPNPSSPIWWMGLIYGVELVLLIVKFYKLHRGDWESGTSKALGIGSFVLGIAAPLMIGSVFGLTESRVTYFGPLMSVYCLLMAILSGLSIFVLYSVIRNRFAQAGGPERSAGLLNDFGKILAYVLGIVVVFSLLKVSMESATTIPEFLVYHKFEHTFGAWELFHTEMILGLFLPFVLSLIPSVRNASAGKVWISALALAGTLAMHMEILLAGQSRPVGPKAEQFPAFISYVPNTWEWLVFISGVAVLLFLYTLGERYLKLDAVS